MVLTPNTSFGGERMERYLVSPTGVPSSVYLAPPSPFSMESRRDSIASSQSSMSSFASNISDYAGPVSPAASHSLLAEEGCVDVMTYDMGHGFERGAHIHDLPFDQPVKPFGSEHGCYGSWETVSHISAFSEGHSLPYSTDLVIRTPGDFSMPTVAENSGLEAGMVQGIDSPWIEVPSVGASDMIQNWESRELGHEVANISLHVPWSGEVQPKQETMESYVPSVAMVDVNNSYVAVERDSFSGSDSFVEVDPLFIPSPQEVSFKQESSPSPRDESDVEETSWSTRRIHVSPTGGKTVKKERRGRNSNSRSRVSKRNKSSSSQKRDLNDTLVGQGDNYGSGLEADPDHADDKSMVFHSGVEVIRKDLMLIRDETTGTLHWGSSKAPVEKHYCSHFIPSTGARCPKEFKRKEHLKRHERTHLLDREFTCKVCTTTFNRHDNLQAHILTHLLIPGKKDGRNVKKPLAELEKYCVDSVSGRKLFEKLHQKWRNEGPINAKL